MFGRPSSAGSNPAFRSAPEEKPRPAPVITTARTAGAAASVWMRRPSSELSSRFMALRASGRLRVSHPTPPDCSQITVPWPTGCGSCLGRSGPGGGSPAVALARLVGNVVAGNLLQGPIGGAVELVGQLAQVVDQAVAVLGELVDMGAHLGPVALGVLTHPLSVGGGLGHELLGLRSSIA